MEAGVTEVGGTEAGGTEAVRVDAGGGGGLDDVGPAGRRRDDSGMATAEYAIATLAACGFAGLLVTILRGDVVRGLLLDVIQRALSLA